MVKKLKTLSIILVCQLALIIFVQLSNRFEQHTSKNEKLLGLDIAHIDEIQIIDGAAKKIALKKENNTWVLPSLNAFEADQFKIEQFLTQMRSIRRGWSLANTSESASRFKVEGDNFERKIVFLNKGMPEKTLILGTSPRYKQIHARIEEEKNIYEIPFGLYEMSIKAQDWVNSEYLHIKENEIAKISLPEYELIKKEETFVLNHHGVESELPQEKIAPLIYKLANINYQEVIDAEQGKAIADKTAKLTYKISLQTGKDMAFSFYPLKQNDSDSYLLKLSNEPVWFKIGSKLVEDITKEKIGSFVKETT